MTGFLNTILIGGLHFQADGFRVIYALIAVWMWALTSLFSLEYFRHEREHLKRYAVFTILTFAATEGVMFSADIIVGFPGETEEEFSETVEFIEKVGFMHLHIFPFSKRYGTEAASMDGQLSQELKYERAARLAAIQSDIKKTILEKYAEEYRNGGDGVLFEQMKDGVNIGHSRHYVEVRVPCGDDLSDRVVPVELTGTDGEVCFGKLI